MYVTNQHLGKFFFINIRIAVLLTSQTFLFSKLGHSPTAMHYYTFKSKALVKKVSIDKEQCLRMGRVPM